MPLKARLKKLVPTASLLLAVLVLPLFAKDSIHQGFFTTSDQVKLHYLESGQGETTILFIPGWLMPADIWEPQLKDLSKDYHVIALDPRSQGGSDMTPKGNDPLRRSQDISELLDQLHLDSVVLVGWSLGAFDTLAYLRQFGPDKVKALVLVDSPLGAPSSPATATQRNPFLQHFQADHEKTSGGYVWSLFKKTQPSLFVKKLTRAAAQVPPEIALSALDNTRPGDAWQPAITTLRKVPILYAVTKTYSNQADYLKQVVPEARVELFENCGHALFVDQADQFDTLLRDFLTQPTANPITAPQTRPTNIPQKATAQPSKILPVQIFSPLASPTKHVKKRPPPSPSPTPTLTATPTKHVPHAKKKLTMATPTPSPTPGLTPQPRKKPTKIPAPTSTVKKIQPALSPALTTLPKILTPAMATPSPRRVKRAKTPAVPSLVHEDFFTTSDHVRLHYLEGGRGLAIVFIPGWLISAEIWRPQLEDLAKDYHVVALDTRSQGESDITPNGNDPIRQSQDIKELIDHLGLNSVVLVGWSHGAFQTLAYMGKFGTDRLYAMVLVDSPLAPASNALSTDSRVRFLNDFQKDRLNTSRGFIWGLFKKTPPPDLLKTLNNSADRTPTDIALALMNNAFPGDNWMPSIPLMRQVPLLYAVTPKYSFQANYLTQVDFQARVEFFQDCGHALFVDDPGRFDATLRDFLHKAAWYPAGLPETKHKKAIPGPGTPTAVARPGAPTPAPKGF